MLFDEIRQHLSKGELAAIELLERSGAVILTEAKLEDCKKKDGSRFRTFSLSGRYDLMIGLKSVLDRPAKKVEPEIEIESEDMDEPFESRVSISGSMDAEPSVEGPVIGDNFWMTRKRWIRMNRDEFFTLVTEEATEDLQAAPVDVIAEVKEKFLRFFDEKDWPLK